MSQQINLLNPALIKQKDFLNPNNIVMTLGVLSVLMLGYYGYAQQQLSLLGTQRSQVAEELSATQAQLKQTALLHTPRAPDKTLLEQITQLEQKEIMQQQILRTVDQSSATPEKGYAALMRAFARQSLDGLWLTSFSFDSQTEKLNISGRTLQAALVPEYITHLGNEPALKGKLFSALNMRLPKADAANSNPATPAAVQISTANSGTSAAPAAASAARQALEPQYIEFALQSTDETSVSGIENTKDEKEILKHAWQIIGSKFEALNPRERWMVACALLVVVYAVINMLLLGPVLERQKILARELEADQSQIQDLNQQISEFSRLQVNDPDAQNKQRIAELQSHLQLLETRLSHLQTTLINPDKMPELLRSLLKKNGNLKLIELKTLPVKGLLENSAENTEQAPKQDAPVFKHGVEITIEGRYLDLLEYVTELEKMPWHVLWSKAALNAEHYPDSQLTLTVYTLSLDQTWLSI